MWYCQSMRRWAWVVAVALAFAATAHAQMARQFPPGARLGELAGQSQPYPMLQIGDKVLRLSPGGRIIDENNRIIMHVYLPTHAHVLYLEDMNGEVSRVFILRPDELEQLKRAAR